MFNVNWKNYRAWLPPLLHLMGVISLIVLAVYLPRYLQGSVTLEKLALIAQIAAIVLILLDINKKFSILRGQTLPIYFNELFLSWKSAFIKLKDVHSESSATVNFTMPLFIVEIHAESTGPVTNDDKFDVLQKELKEVKRSLKELANDIASAKRTTDQRIADAINLVTDEVESKSKEILNRVVSVNAGGLTLSAWSVFLLAYSAILTYCA